MKPLLLAASMQPATRRVRDDMLSLKLITAQEVTEETFTLIDAYRGVNGWFFFGPDKPKVSDIPDTNAVVEGDQTPSQLLRGVLWLLHQKRGGTQESWPAFYSREMERIRQKVIDSLE